MLWSRDRFEKKRSKFFPISLRISFTLIHSNLIGWCVCVCVQHNRTIIDHRSFFKWTPYLQTNLISLQERKKVIFFHFIDSSNKQTNKQTKQNKTKRRQTKKEISVWIIKFCLVDRDEKQCWSSRCTSRYENSIKLQIRIIQRTNYYLLSFALFSSTFFFWMKVWIIESLRFFWLRQSFEIVEFKTIEWWSIKSIPTFYFWNDIIISLNEIDYHQFQTLLNDDKKIWAKIFTINRNSL